MGGVLGVVWLWYGGKCWFGGGLVLSSDGLAAFWWWFDCGLVGGLLAVWSGGLGW